MLERIPEVELMDDTEQARAYAEADFSEPHNAFVEYFKSRFSDFREGHVLDLGCGTADVIIRFARVYPRTHITGIDGARAMLDIGMRDIKMKGLAHRISIQRRLLPDAALSTKKYDAVISNSLLHHLENPHVIWDAVRACAKRKAPILVMDLLRPDSMQRADELVQLYASDASPVLKKDFYNSLLAAYDAEEVQEQLQEANLAYLTVETVSDRHLLVWGKSHES